MTIPNSVVDDFGEIYIKEVRDRTLAVYDKLKRSEMQSAHSRQLSRVLQQISADHPHLLDQVVMEIVDLMLFHSLNCIEQHCELVMEDQVVTDLSDGLAGELYSEEGWIQRFSHYPCIEK